MTERATTGAGEGSTSSSHRDARASSPARRRDGERERHSDERSGDRHRDREDHSRARSDGRRENRSRHRERGDDGDRRSRRRSDSGSDSDSSTTGASDRHRSSKRRRDSREREDRSRKEHKHKKHKKEKKRTRDADKERDLDERIERTKALIQQVDSAPPSSLPSILTSADYFQRSAEFRLWLHSAHDLHLDSISTERAHELFDAFVQLWNARRLDAHFYTGVDSSALSAAVLTKHRWPFTARMTDDERLAMASTRDTVDTATHHHTYSQEFSSAASHPTPSPAPPPPIAAPSSSQPSRPSTVDRRRQRERTELVLDEVAPRETGREGRLEKRRAMGEYARRERGEDGLEADEEELMGGGGGGGRGGEGEREKMRERQRRRDERKEEEGRARRSEYEAKERDRMKRMLESIGMADKYPIK